MTEAGVPKIDTSGEGGWTGGGGAGRMHRVKLVRAFTPVEYDTSPTYLYVFIVPCYYIICFGCLMGFTIHFYIIFGTNLLTGGPAQIVVFLPISVFRRKGISNGVQTE